MPNLPPNVHVIEHPLVQHKLTLMRKRQTSTNSFRRLLSELSALLAYEVTREMPMHAVEIETPLEPMKSNLIDGKKIVFVSILRAGAGIGRCRRSPFRHEVATARSSNALRRPRELPRARIVCRSGL